MRQGRGGGAQLGFRGAGTSFTPGWELADCSGGCGRGWGRRRRGVDRDGGDGNVGLQPSYVSPSTKNETMRWKFTSVENPSMQPSCLRSIQPKFRVAKILQAARSVLAVGNSRMWNHGSLFAARKSFDGCKCSMRFWTCSLLHPWLYVTQSAIEAATCHKCAGNSSAPCGGVIEVAVVTIAMTN